MASDPEIKDGFTLPVWMKTKPTKDFEPFAASPPPPEDSFFYIRYPKTDTLFGKTKLAQDLPNLVTEQPKEFGTASAFSTVKDKDWSKHTKPCQDVLHGIAPINTAVNSVSSKPKPAGVDDGFKGEGAACGTSIVKVAHQMISSTRGPRGFTVASPSEDPAESQYHFARRGSKSLPVTPAHSPPSSPNSRRRMHGNRYFTSPFEPSEEGQGRSWLTMALLGFKKDLASSTSTLAEEDALDARLHGVTLAESVESLGPAPRDNSKIVREAAQTRAPSIPPGPAAPSTSAANAFRPKPNELRELNFWSPTSM